MYKVSDTHYQWGSYNIHYESDYMWNVYNHNGTLIAKFVELQDAIECTQMFVRAHPTRPN